MEPTSRKLCRLLLMFLLTDFTSFFSLYWLPSLSLCMVFDAIWFIIDEVLSTNPFANNFVVGDFNVHHNDWLSYSGGTDTPDELCYNFSISNDLTQMVNFPDGFLSDPRLWFSQSCSFRFISSDTNIGSAMAFPPLVNSDHFVVSVSIDISIILITTGCPVSSHCLWLFLCWLEWS